MKGVKKCLSSFYCRLALVLFTVLLSSLFSVASANASDYETFNVYYRSYQVESNSVVNESGFNRSGTSVRLLLYDSSDQSVKRLKGFSADFAVDDSTSYNYKTLTVTAEMMQAASSGNSFSGDVPAYISIGTTTGAKTSDQCNFTNGVNRQGISNKNYAVWTCTVSWYDSGVGTNAQLVIGNIVSATSSSPNVAYIMPTGNSGLNYGNADIYIYSLGYELSGSNDPSVQTLNEISSAVTETNDYLEQQQEQDQQDRDNMQEVSDDAGATADSSQQSAESTGTTLLAGFQAFINALNSASASDCSLDFNIMGYIDGGQVDLCTLSIPPALQTISSLILIGFCVPLSIATARKLINLFRSFQS